MYVRLMLLGLVAAAGCGAAGTSSTQACTDVANARCARLMTCSSGAAITRTYGDMTTCVARERLACTLGQNAPATGSTPAALEQCAAALPTAVCADLLGNNPPPECVYKGPRANGAPCAFGGQCGSTYCDNDKVSSCGTCGDPPAVGLSCTVTNCARGQVCTSRTSTCERAGSAGSQCENDTLPCGADLTCVGAVMGAMGACMPAIATEGAPCGGTLAGCDVTIGLSCDGAGGNRACVPLLFATDGMPCGNPPPNGAFVDCGQGGRCYTASGVALAGEVGTCKAAVLEGKACDVTLGPPCLAPARCVVSGGGSAGVCTLPSGPSCG